MALAPIRTYTFDVSTAIGIITAIALVLVAIILSGTPHAFIDLPAVLIVIGGTFATTTACFTIPEVFRAQKLVLKTVFYKQVRPYDVARYVVDIARRARQDTPMALQNHMAADRVDSFLEKGLNLVIDGSEETKVRYMMNQDIHALLERHGRGVSIFRKSAEIAPAMGLIGTLIGLVQMLANLSDPSSIGPAMAVALLTTLYGALLSYMVFTPLAAKLEHNTDEEVLIRRLYMEGVLSIARQENPRQLESLINSILPPSSQVRSFNE